MEKVAELELQLEEALKKALKEDRLDREKAFKLFGYKLWNASAHAPPADTPPSNHRPSKTPLSAPFLTYPRRKTVPLAVSFEELAIISSSDSGNESSGVPDYQSASSEQAWEVQRDFEGRTICTEVEKILHSFGMLEDYQKRLSQVETKCEEINSRKEDWKKIFLNQSLPSDIPHPSFLDEMSQIASFPTDVVKLKLRSKPDSEFCSKKIPHHLQPNCLISRITAAIVEYGYRNSVFCIKFGIANLAPDQDLLKDPEVRLLLRGIMDLLKEQSSRGFALGFGMFGKDAVLAVIDSETLRIARWNCWTATGLRKIAALYRTLLCSSAYNLGLCPLFFDFQMGTSTTNYDPTVFDPTLEQYSLEPESLEHPSSSPFHRRPNINCIKNILSEDSESRVIKIAQQARYSQEATALKAIQHLVKPGQTSSVPKLLSSHTFQRLLYQVDQKTIESEGLETSVQPIICRHLEVIITSTSSRGDLFHHSVSTAQDLFVLFSSLICTVRSLWPTVIHGDISSSNVLKMVDGGFCLIDFDGAKLVVQNEGGKGEVSAALTGTQDTMSISLLRSSNLGRSRITREKYTLNQEFESIAYLFWKFLTKKLHIAIGTGNLAGPKSHGCPQKWVDEFNAQDWIDSSDEAEQRRKVFWLMNIRGTAILIGLLKFRGGEENNDLLRFLITTPTSDTIIDKFVVKTLLDLTVEISNDLLEEWTIIYTTLGWDTYRENVAVIGARMQLWSRDPSQLFYRIQSILQCFGGLDDAGLLQFLDSLREWGESINIGIYIVDGSRM